MPAGTRVAVIGEGTAAAALTAGFRVDLRAPEASGGQLAEALAGHNPRPTNVLFVRGSRARPDFAETLRSAAVPVTELTVYDTQPAVERDQEMVARLLRNEIDAVTLLSPSAVEGFRAQAGEVWERARLVPAVCIGQTTASASRTAGMVHVHVSGTASVDGIVAALQTHVRTYIGQPAGESARNEEGKNAS
jgi:uroporphyrinogen-III synthase